MSTKTVEIVAGPAALWPNADGGRGRARVVAVNVWPGHLRGRLHAAVPASLLFGQHGVEGHDAAYCWHDGTAALLGGSHGDAFPSLRRPLRPGSLWHSHMP